MPKRKAPTKISGLLGSDDEDLIQYTENESAPFPDTRNEPPVKRRRGRPRSSNETATEPKPTQGKNQQLDPASQDEATAKKPTRRGRPRGSGRTSDNTAGQAQASVIQEPIEEEGINDQENEDPTAAKNTKTSRAAKAKQAAPAARRGRGRAPSAPKQTDGEFEYTPTRPTQAQRPQPELEVMDSQMNDEAEPEVEESILPNPSSTRFVPSSPAKHARARMAAVRSKQDASPYKRKSGVEVDQGGDPELRRRIGDLTKKHDGLETKYRNLREIGIVEANTNMEKLRKQCESITTGMFLIPNNIILWCQFD